MRLYNTLTRSEEDFAPGRDNRVRMYTCGLTVYARGHIGNFRTFICVDVLRRTLKYLLGYDVRQVMNFTDVDDRTILGAQKAGKDLRSYTDQYIAMFREDARALGLEQVEESPRATDQANITAMADLIRALEKNGHTYVSDGSIYFKISTLPEYGKLAHLEHDVKKGFRPSAVRLLLLSAHYRKQLNFTWDSLAAYEESLRRLTDFLARLDGVMRAGTRPGIATRVEDARKAFAEAMQDDLNTAAALGAIFELVRALNSAIDSGEIGTGDVPVIREAFDGFDKVLGVISLRRAEDEQPPVPMDEIERLIEDRQAARRRRDFGAADRIRDDLAARGVLLEDSSGGTRWKRK